MTTYIRGELTRWVSDDFPGVVECRFADKFGVEWIIIDKAPILTNEDLSAATEFPRPTLIACELVARRPDDTGHHVCDVTIKTPWALEATDGTTSFQLYDEQLQQA